MAEPLTFKQTTAGLLRGKLNSGERPVLINALDEEAYMAKRIPGSISVPAEHPEWIHNIVPAKAQDIVVYCANADCPASANLAESLVDEGYTRVWDYEDGLAGWEEEGYGLVVHFKSFIGLRGRLIAKVTTVSLLQQLNEQNDQPINHIKHALAA